jgi:hypothetical protein
MPHACPIPAVASSDVRHSQGIVPAIRLFSVPFLYVGRSAGQGSRRGPVYGDVRQFHVQAL